MSRECLCSRCHLFTLGYAGGHHPTVKSGQQGIWRRSPVSRTNEVSYLRLAVIRDFGAKFESPTADEGFDRIWSYEPPAETTPTTLVVEGDTSTSPSNTEPRSLQALSAGEMDGILQRLHGSTFDASHATLVINGPLPPAPPKKKKAHERAQAVSRNMDITKFLKRRSERSVGSPVSAKRSS